MDKPKRGIVFWLFLIVLFTFIYVNLSLGYSSISGTNATLDVWDETDSSEKLVAQPVIFYANYTNSSTGQPVNDSNASCTISFKLDAAWDSPKAMTFNSSGIYWYYNRTFYGNGTMDYNVSCDGTVSYHDKLNVSENFIINYSTPSVTLGLLDDEKWLNTVNASVNCSATDSVSFVNVSLYTDAYGSWILNLSQDITGTNNGTTFVLPNLADNNTGYVWNCEFLNNLSVSSFASANRTFFVDTVFPNATLYLNDTEVEFSTGYVLIDWNASDLNVSDEYCNVTYPDGSLLSSFSSDTTDINLTPSNLTAIGYYNVTVFVNDSATNSNITISAFYVNDSTVPTISLLLPEANYWNDTSDPYNVTFNCSATDNHNVTNISLYLSNNQNSSFAYNTSASVSGTSTYANWTLSLANGNYTWNCYAEDGYSNSDWDANRTILINYTIPPDNPPSWSSNSTSIVSTYSAVTESFFNVTWTDDNSVNITWFESNYSGNAQNYSMNKVTGDIFNYSAILPAGTHYWKSWANDSANQWNYSDTWTFNIAKASGTMDLYINGSTDDFTGNVTAIANITCALTTPSSGNITIYENGAILNSSDASSVTNIRTYSTIGNHNITCILHDHQNYTVSDQSWINTSDTVVPTVSQIIPAPNYWNDTSDPYNVTFNCSATDNYELTNISLYLSNSLNASFVMNSTASVSGSSAYANWTLSLANGNYTWNCYAEDNYSNTDWGTNRTILINYTIPTDDFPAWSSNSTSIVSTYSAVTESFFNITWTDDNVVNITWFESNYSGNAQNYSMNKVTGDIYNYSVILPAGTHYWKSWANDSADQWNYSDAWTFSIAKAAGTMNLYINGSSDDYTSNVTAIANITCVLTTPTSGNITIYENGAIINSSDSGSVTNIRTYSSISNYNITCILHDHQNYTVSDQSWVNTSDSIAPVVSLNSPSASFWNDTSDPYSTTFNCSATDNHNLSNISLYLTNKLNTSFVFNSSGDVSGTSASLNWTLDLANGNYTWNCFAEDNYSNTDWGTNRTILINYSAGDAPVVTLNTQDNIWRNQPNITLNCSATDDIGLANATLYHDIGGWAVNETKNLTGLDNSTTFTLTTVADNYIGITWNCLVYDNLSNSDWGTNRTFFIDTATPQFSYHLNDSDVDYGSGSILIDWNVTDANVSTKLCNVSYPNGSRLVQSTDDSTDIILSANLTEIGTYTVTIFANDTATNVNSTTTEFNVTDLSAPTVTLISPDANFWNDTADPYSVTFNCSATDNYNVTNISLYLSNSLNASFAYNTSATVSGTSAYANWTLSLDNGNYTWNCFAKDEYNHTDWGNNRTILINYSIGGPPVPSLDMPPDNHWFNSDPVLNCSATDDIGLANVTLYHDIFGWQSNETKTLSGLSDSQGFTLTGLADNYTGITWNCLVYDNLSNSDWGINRTFFYDTMEPNVTVYRNNTVLEYMVDSILIDWNVTDANISSRQLNITYPDTILLSTFSDDSVDIILTPSNLTMNGTYIITIFVNDSAGNINSTTLSFVVNDTIAPTVALTYPENNSWSTTTSNTFNCSGNDTGGLANVTLYHNFEGLWKANETNPLSGTTASTSFTIDLADNSSGYLWNCLFTDHDGNSNWSTVNRTLKVDTISPSVSISLNSSTAEYGTGSILIDWNVSDVNNDTYYVNISYPNSSLLGQGTNPSVNIILNGSNLTATGSYTVKAWINDSVQHINYTSDSFIVQDTSAPNVSLNSPQQNVWLTNSTVVFNCTVNATNGIANVTLYTNITGTWAPYQTQALTGTLNSTTFTYSSVPDNMEYIWNCHGYNLVSNSANATSNRTFKVDTTVPSFSSVTVYPKAIINGSRVNITASITDNLQLNASYAQVTQPDSVKSNVSLPHSYIANKTGRYNITFYANDSAGNINTYSKYFMVEAPIPVNITVETPDNSTLETNVTIYYDDEVITVNTSAGNYTNYNLPNISVDIKFKPNLTMEVKLRGVNLSQNTNASIGFDKRPSPVSGYITTYGVKNTYNFSDATVQISYAGASLTNENYLGTYKCDNWNFTSRTCLGSWSSVTGTQNSTGDYFEITVTSFSGFSVKQETVPSSPPGDSSPPGSTPSGPGGSFLPPATCEEDWVCGDWKPAICPINGTQTSECNDWNECNTTLLIKTRDCIYIPTCNDSIKNGDETGIDCGGKCPACVVEGAVTTEAGAVCGDGVRDENENRRNCCIDTGCGYFSKCIDNTCVPRTILYYYVGGVIALILLVVIVFAIIRKFKHRLEIVDYTSPTQRRKERIGSGKFLQLRTEPETIHERIAKFSEDFSDYLKKYSQEMKEHKKKRKKTKPKYHKELGDLEVVKVKKTRKKKKKSDSDLSRYIK